MATEMQDVSSVAPERRATKQIRGWRDVDQELLERVLTLGRARITIGDRHIRTQREAVFMGLRVLERALRDPTLWNALVESRRAEEAAMRLLNL